nr:hypothetical protein [uncultured Treponema sp.]
MLDNFVLVIDTETANSVEQPLPYDFGWAVVDTTTGEILETASYVCAEIFLDKEMMEQAYFAEKIPSYWQDIKQGTRKLTSFLKIRKALWTCMKTYGIKQVGAYNMGFDKRATNNDARYLTASFFRWFFPYGTEFFCIWNMACTSFLNTSDYVNYATIHGFVSDAGNIQTSAECAYRFLTANKDFAESHTGLEDVLIEVTIMMNCLKMGDESMKFNPYTACWRTVQKMARQMELEEVF